MPSRADIFINDAFYHVYDRNIEPLRIFTDSRICCEFINVFLYYRSEKSHLRYSFFKKLKSEDKKAIGNQIFTPTSFKVDIISFCLMPNHYHFLLRQRTANGIISFMSNSLNSLTRFYNIQHKRKGPVFLPQFRSRRILDIEQLIYCSRYIHTNPYADEVVKTTKGIFTYPFSSISAYGEGKQNKYKIDTSFVLNYFKGNYDKYKEFILKNAEDQKMWEILKYTEKWR